MNVLIFETEVYLRQKIAMRLQHEGHDCTNITNLDELETECTYDTVLISLNLNDEDLDFIVNKYSQCSIIFLGTCNEQMYKKYINTNQVDDYISKPFSIDELFRKISHFDNFKGLREENQKLEYYYNFIEKKKTILDEEKENLTQNCNTFNNFNSILTIDNYIKEVIVSFQNKHSDTELSSRLGINRKTLWVKRNKLNI